MLSYINDTSTEHIQSCRALTHILKQKLSERKKQIDPNNTEIVAKEVIDSVQETPKTHNRHMFVIRSSSNECTVATPKSMDKTTYYHTKSVYPFVERVEYVKPQRKSVFDFELKTMTEELSDKEQLSHTASPPKTNTKDERTRMEGLFGRLREYTEKNTELEESLNEYNAKHPFMTETQAEEFSLQCYLLRREVEIFHENYNQVFNKKKDVSFIISFRVSLKQQSVKHTEKLRENLMFTESKQQIVAIHILDLRVVQVINHLKKECYQNISVKMKSKIGFVYS